MLTKKEQKVLDVIRQQLHQTGEFPSYSTLAEQLGYKSKNSVSIHVQNLLDKNLLIKSEGSFKLTDSITQFYQDETIDVPLLGEVACGSPIFAKENLESYYAISKKLISPHSQYFLLRANGDSMNEGTKTKQSICEGDMVLIKVQNHADNGDWVLALINNEATIKEYRKESNYVALIPHSDNESHKPIILDTEFLIQGVVENVFKNLN